MSVAGAQRLRVVKDLFRFQLVQVVPVQLQLKQRFPNSFSYMKLVWELLRSCYYIIFSSRRDIYYCRLYRTTSITLRTKIFKTDLCNAVHRKAYTLSAADKASDSNDRKSTSLWSFNFFKWTKIYCFNQYGFRKFVNALHTARH